ncbi:TPA: ATP-binding protein, partial [Vibrio vulnificus]|nr:ATP-binding protein [Vibrio vulnificus]
NEVENLRLPTWQQVQNRYYETWQSDVIKIDTAGKNIEMSFAELTEKLGV